jgi:Skp family chaperone for outer membrane proteins
MILLVTGCAVLAAGAYFGASLFAQGTATPPTTPAAPTGTKVGVVNVGYVFNGWKKATRFKDELERAAEPFNKQAKVLQEEMVRWDTEVRSKPGMSKAEVDSRQEAIKKNKRELEDLAGNMRKLLGKKSEDNLVMLWKEANECIKGVSEAYGFSIVMGYGDPLDKGLMDLFPNVNRKMNAMDGGAAVPLYVHASSDLSDAVTRTLNHWDELRNKASGVQPTSGGVGPAPR